jgi:hypothetical protein
VHGPPRCCHRGHRAEQVFLFFQRGDVGQAVRTVSDRYGQVGENDTRIVGVPGDAAILHGHRHGLSQPAAISQLGQQRRAGMTDQVLGVGYHFGVTDRATTVHFQGALLLVDFGCCSNNHSSRQESFLRGRAHRWFRGWTNYRG